MNKPVALFFPFDLLSHYSRCLMLAKAIENEFDCQFVYSKRYANLVAQFGFSMFPCKNFDANYVMECAEQFDFSWLQHKILEDIFMGQVQVIQDLQPAFVLGDVAPTLKMAAEITKTTFLALSNAYISKFYKFTRELPPSHPAFQFRDKTPVRFYNWMLRAGERSAFKRIHRPFRRIRKAYNLNLKPQNYQDELEGDLNLICDDPELFPLQKKIPENYFSVGPLYLKMPTRIKSSIKFQGKAKNKVLVSCGSSGNFKNFKMFAHPLFAEYDFIFTSPVSPDISQRNIQYAPFLNFSYVLPQTDLVICHGGNGTIYQAISHGIPVLCFPVHFEQFWNSQRIQSLKLGEQLSAKTPVEKLAAVVEKWIASKVKMDRQSSNEKYSVESSQSRFHQIVVDSFKPEN
ncbi:MAG: hypothetical protein DWQ05_17490 [Calditrichaeota bacterium]|nr:MAG: hypothetical protein DWQ05_17490 [Calditrichota bacterium]